MPNEKNPFQDAQMHRYFDSLPAFIQESILQSGVKFESVGALRDFADHLKR